MEDRNMVANAVVRPEAEEDDVDVNEAASEDGNCNEEFQAINSQLDQLNSVLDCLEQKNDDIHAKLVELLQSNRETRKQFQESQKPQDFPMDTDAPMDGDNSKAV